MEPAVLQTSASNGASEFLNVIMSSSSSKLSSPSLSSKTCDKNWKTDLCQNSSSAHHLRCSSLIPGLSTTQPHKRPATTVSLPFVPILKTRSQKKLDQIMQKHNMRRLMLKECHEMKDVPRAGAWWVKKKRRKFFNTPQHPKTYLTHESFMSALGLARVSDVAALATKDSRSGQEVDLNYEIVSVGAPLSAVTPLSASENTSSVSPRSTRSLISQLGRDGEVSSRRRLNFCFVEDEWADKEALNEGRNPLQFSLLTLEFSSPLGQRVRKYVRGEGYLNIIKDVESYCRTELDDDSYSKLRFRASDFRVVYRKKRRASSYVHKYKFNKNDRVEFKKLLKTGLNFSSRQLRQSLPVCKIVLKRLAESEIKSWTEERKITITEEIIFDDDVSITHIDIPESRVTQGFTADSPSQHLYKHSHRHTPSSPVPLSRLNSATDSSRSAFSHGTSASPPHVPNIFRNRTSYTSSPPRPGSMAGSRNSTSSQGPQNQSNQIKKTPGEQRYKANSQHQSSGKGNQSLTHLSGHACLSPSSYSVRNSSVVGLQGYGDFANRRKQQWTHVRKDDSDGSGSHHADAKIGLTAVSPSTTNICSMGPSENKHTMQNQGLFVPASTGHLLQPSTRKLSNFDYFSIRDGKMPPSYSHRSPTVISQHRTCPSSGPHQHNNQSQGLSQKSSQPDRSGQNHSSVPSSSLASPAHSHSSATHQQSHGRSSSGPQCKPLQQRKLQDNHNSEKASLSVNQSTPNTTKSQSVKDMNTVIPSLMEHLQNTVSLRQGFYHKSSTNLQRHHSILIDDDDVMEVICIDDD